VWRIPVPWEGSAKHFTKDFEAFALALMREMPMKRAGEIIGEDDTRLWRMLFAHMALARQRLDLSELVSLGVDEMSSRKGHNYLSVFADLVERRVVFATEGKDHTTFERFCEDLLRHNGHPKAITQVAVDLSAAYQKGIRENLGNARMVFDPFHVSALVSTAVDEVRRLEAREGTESVRDSLKGSMYLFRKNPENLTPIQNEALAALDLKHLATGVAYPGRSRSPHFTLFPFPHRTSGVLKMAFLKSVISFGVLAAAATANASILGYHGNNYLVVEGARRYSVMDVYINCDGAYDKCVNFYGQNLSGKNAWVVTTKNGVRNENDAATATNGAAFVHSNSTGWMPNSNASASAWDSFVTIGARDQTEAQTSSAITGDPYFVNGGTAGAETIRGGYNSSNPPAYVGGGWYSASPLYIGDLAGSYSNKRLMLGRFTIDVTDVTATDVISIEMHGQVTMKVNGASAGLGTITQPTFTLTQAYATFFVSASDTTPPTLTAGTINACYSTVTAAEAAAKAATTATDTGGAVTKTASTSGTCSAVVTVTGTDPSGNSATVTYNTRIDSTAPVVTLKGNASVNLNSGDPYTDPGTSATDNCDGSLTPTVSGTVGTTPGTYTLTYTATDTCGNVGTATRTVTITQPQQPASIAALSLSSGTLSPSFASATTIYTASVGNAVTSVTVTPTVSQANATVRVRVNSGSWASVTSGAASGSLSLSVGTNTVEVEVTAQDATTTTTYSVAVTRRTNLEDWRVNYFSSAANAGNGANTANPQGDGLSNLEKYAFGLDPTASLGTGDRVAVSGGTITRGRPTIDVQSNSSTSIGVKARFVRRKTYVVDGLTYTVRFSNDLSTWLTSTATPTVVASDADFEVVEVPYPLFIGGKKAGFFSVVLDLVN